ncbi:MAG: hypothetical protein Q8908_02160 [Bacteroidota bacterium]|nr:hypothetical protein [Bacteroidota bacterium]
MKTLRLLLMLFMIATFSINGFAQDTLSHPAKDTLLFNGQLSSWGLYNEGNSLPVYLGGRYLPTLNETFDLTDNRKIDFEASANLYGTLGVHPFDRSHTDGSLNLYRAWARYSTQQLEIRLGLQKISFGSATLLRPLMWFDQIDPRDPLQLTNGVWGLLGRYYFLNNANLWLWGLYGNDKTRPWDAGKTNQKQPEYGGRFQVPVTKGEVAVSFHHRTANTLGLADTIPAYPSVAENRIGLDGKWDLGVGFWFEGTWVNKTKEVGIYTNQEILNVGTDNTFGIGNGLHAVFEQLLLAFDKKAFTFIEPVSFTGLSLSYPAGMNDNLSTITYYDWNHKNAYNFANWKHQFNKLAFYVMAFWNPVNYKLPQQDNAANFYSGKGIQLMLVFNH